MVLLLVLHSSLPSGQAQQPVPQPGLPGGGMWQHPPERMVPIKVVDGVILATGSISAGKGGQDSGPLNFIVDTAATSTMIDVERARRLGWAAPGPQTGPYKGRTLELAGASVAGRPVYEMALASMARQIGDPIDGVAGSDIFANFGVRIDYLQHGLTLVLPASCATPEKKLHVRMVGGLPFVEASVGLAGGARVSGNFLLDTGQAGTGLIFTSEFLAKHSDLTAKQATVHLPAFDSSGVMRQTAFVRVADLQIGDAMLHGVVASVAPPAGGDTGLAGVIAGGVLGRFDVLVDLPNRWLTLTPNADFAAPFEADMSGLLLLSGEAYGRSGEGNGRRVEAVYTIAGIAEKSPASDAGLQQGDRLVTLGGRKVTDMSMDQIRGILKSSPGTKVLVGIDRSGKGLQVTLTLRRAI